LTSPCCTLRKPLNLRRLSLAVHPNIRVFAGGRKSDPEVLVFLDLADGVLIILLIKVNFQSGILNPEEAHMVERLKLS